MELEEACKVFESRPCSMQESKLKYIWQLYNFSLEYYQFIPLTASQGNCLHCHPALTGLPPWSSPKIWLPVIWFHYYTSCTLSYLPSVFFSQGQTHPGLTVFPNSCWFMVPWPVAFLWTPYNLSASFLTCIVQNWTQYSRWGLTKCGIE